MSLTLEFFYQKTRYTYNLDLLTASTSASPVRMICTFFPIMACVSLKKNTMAREPAPEKLPFPPDTAPEIASA